MRSVNFEFVLKKNEAENRILNDFTLSSCKLRLTLTFKSQFEQFPYGEDNVFTLMLENNSAKRKVISHCYNFLLPFLGFIAFKESRRVLVRSSYFAIILHILSLWLLVF